MSQPQQKTKNIWKHLSKPPFSHRIAHVFVLNTRELLILPFCQTKRQFCDVWKYNFESDTYTNWISQNRFKGLNLRYYSAALNSEKSLLFLFGESGHIIQIDLSKKKVVKSKRHFYDGSHAQSLFIDGQMHVFGGWEQPKTHSIWDLKRKKLVKIAKLSKLRNGINGFSLTHSKRLKSVFLTNESKIYKYSVHTHKLQILLSDLSVSFPQSVVTRNGKYLIVSDTQYNHTLKGTIERSEAIHFCVIDLQTLTVRKSKHLSLCLSPSLTNINPCLMLESSANREHLLSFGYVRLLWKLPSLSRVEPLPFCLIQLIDSFYAIEVLHMFDAKFHSCLNIDCVLNVEQIIIDCV